MVLNVFHGSNAAIPKPDLKHSRKDIDFGKGFYITEDFVMAAKWASRKDCAFISEYKLDLTGLNVAYLNLDKTWVDFVASNRGYSEEAFDLSQIDVVIGPTADDKMFGTLENYFNGFLSLDDTIKCLNIMKFSNQIALINEKSLSRLQYIKNKKLTSEEAQYYQNLAKHDRKIALNKMRQYFNIKNNNKQNIFNNDLKALSFTKISDSIEDRGDDYDER